MSLFISRSIAASHAAMPCAPAVLYLTSIAVVTANVGCTGVRQYFHNGCKVGPDYCKPAAPVAEQWIDANDKRVNTGCDDMCAWWKVFSDPSLDALICTAYHQNLTLREAGFRILQARAQLGIATGEMFPQTQNLTGNYSRIARSRSNGRRVVRTAILQSVGLWFQPRLGTRLLGSLPPRRGFAGRYS